MKHLKQYAGIFKGIRIPWAMVLLILVMEVGNSYLELSQITLTADIIDSAQKTIDLDRLIRFIGSLLGYAVVAVALVYIKGWTWQRINYGVRVKTWRKLMHLPTRYYDQERGDSLVSRITTDISQSYVYFEAAAMIVTAVYATVVVVRRMYAYSPQLTGYMIFLVPVTVIIAALFGKLSYVANQKVQHTFAGTMSYLVERTRNLRLIKAACMEVAELAVAKGKFDRQFWAGFLTVLTNCCNVLIIEVLNCATIIISFVLGGRLVAAGEITVGRLIGFYSLSSMLYIRLTQLVMFYGQVKAANGRLSKIAQVLDTPDETDEGIEMDVADADLTLSGVSLAYGGRSALQEVSCHIPKGRITAVIGSNGAGKTTLFKLLERMYDPDQGVILFGDTDVKEFSLSSWRRSFAIVAQDRPLLSGTVRENMLYGVRRKVKDEELVRVARLANVYDFVQETPGGFDAQVGPGGANFSGGQCQCIAIARAMMHNPDYLLLDEATSNLDACSEKLVSQALVNLMRGRTTVMIAHNYSAVSYADHVIVMKGGRVEAEGTPEELMRTNGYYRALSRMSGEG